MSENFHSKILERKLLSKDTVINIPGCLLSSAQSQARFILFVKEKVPDSRFTSGNVLLSYLKSHSHLPKAHSEQLACLVTARASGMQIATLCRSLLIVCMMRQI